MKDKPELPDTKVAVPRFYGFGPVQNALSKGEVDALSRRSASMLATPPSRREARQDDTLTQLWRNKSLQRSSSEPQAADLDYDVLMELPEGYSSTTVTVVR